MFGQAKRDAQTVTPDGTRVDRVIQDVKVRYSVTQVDERGSITEIYDPAWGFHPEPLVYAYAITIRPGVVKGWVAHHDQDDRITLLAGTVKIVLYDGRPDSPTYGLINEFFFSEHNRGMIIFPKGVCHAIQNIGLIDALLLNLPTRPYNHLDPDKYRLPLDTDLIPYTFK